MNLNQVTVYSSKPIETVEFFQRLGLKVIVDSLPRYARLECPDGESTLSIHETTTADDNSNIVLYFECEQVDVEVNRLKSLGLSFDQDPTDQTWLWREAYLRDPNGNRICLFTANENRKNPPWKVS
jgi:predicted enzyme related to lactoylglutathione lyase